MNKQDFIRSIKREDDRYDKIVQQFVDSGAIDDIIRTITPELLMSKYMTSFDFKDIGHMFVQRFKWAAEHVANQEANNED